MSQFRGDLALIEAHQTPQTPLMRVSDYVQQHARLSPNLDAMVLGSERVSYQAFHARVEELARALLAAGVEHGDRVATLCTPHPDYFVTMLATASIGAIWVGLNPRYRAEELTYVTQDCDPKVLFSRLCIGDRQYADDIARMRQAAPSLQYIVSLDSDVTCPGTCSYSEFLHGNRHVNDEELSQARARCAPRDPCLIVYTSGSTGRPKGALLCHQGIVDFAIGQNSAWPLSRHICLNYFPINHVGCVVDLSCPTLIAGGCIVFLEQFDPEASLRLTASERITLWASVPSVFQLQLAHPSFDSYDLSSIELIVWEGAPMPADMIRRLRAICPLMATNYSLTETTGAVTIVTPTSDEEVLTYSVGVPFDGVEIRLAGPDGTEVPEGTEGEIQSRSRYNMLGYWRRPAETDAALRDGWLRTGDLGVRRPDGRYRIVGRLKEMYKSGGYNVYPREVESAIESHPGVALVAVIGVSDPLWQEVGVAYVIPKGNITSEELEAHCRAHLANYKVPKQFVIRRDLPLLPIGKIDKPALRREAESGTATVSTRTGK